MPPTTTDRTKGSKEEQRIKGTPRQQMESLNAKRVRCLGELNSMKEKTYENPQDFQTEIRDTVDFLREYGLELKVTWGGEEQKENANSVDYEIKEADTGRVKVRKHGLSIRKVLDELAKEIDNLHPAMAW